MKQKKAVIKNLSSLENLSSGSKESKVISESSHKYSWHITCLQEKLNNMVFMNTNLLNA